MFGWLKKWTAPSTEKRSSGSGFTSEIISARQSYILGRQGLAEITSTAQSCVSLWEGAFAMADVEGADLDRRILAMAARNLALRGEALFWISDGGLIPAADWDLSTINGKPKAYRVSISEAGGGRSMTLLAAEVLHFRIGVDSAEPWRGSAPLRRASLSAGLLHAVEGALAEAYEMMPLGSSIVPMPEISETDSGALGRSFRGQRGRVLLRESVNVSAAGGPAPNADWRPADLTPNLQQSMALETFEAARAGVMTAFGVLPCLFDAAGQGPAIRECQRHLAAWTLQPIASLMAEECEDKLGVETTIDILRPIQAFDAGGRARAISTMVAALAQAKTAGLAPGDLAAAMALVNLGPGSDGGG